MGNALENKIQNFLDQIEFAINNFEYDSKLSEIIDYVSRKIGYSKSDIGTIFLYISNQALISYIRKRKLTIAYEDLKNNRGSIIDIAFKYGYSDQAAFTKAFKNLFGTTPKKLTEVDTDKLQKPLTTDMILTGDEEMSEIQNICRNNIDSNNAQFFDFYRQIRDLSAMYGFNDELTNICIDLKENYNFKLKDAFEFLDEYIFSHSMDKNSIHTLHDIKINDEYIELYKNYSLSLQDIDTIVNLSVEHNMQFDDWDLSNINFLIKKLEFSAFHATIIENNCSQHLGITDFNQGLFDEFYGLIDRVSIPFYSWDYDEYNAFVYKQVEEILEIMSEECAMEDYLDSLCAKKGDIFNDPYFHQDEFDYLIKSNEEENYYNNKLDRLEEQLFYGYDELEDDYD